MDNRITKTCHNVLVAHRKYLAPYPASSGRGHCSAGKVPCDQRAHGGISRPGTHKRQHHTIVLFSKDQSVSTRTTSFWICGHECLVLSSLTNFLSIYVKHTYKHGLESRQVGATLLEGHPYHGIIYRLPLSTKTTRGFDALEEISRRHHTWFTMWSVWTSLCQISKVPPTANLIPRCRRPTIFKMDNHGPQRRSKT